MVDVELRKLMEGFVLSDSQVQEVYNRLDHEISRGLKRSTHEQSSIKCYPTYVQELPTGEELGDYLALDLGGTNFRVLLVSLKGHHEAEVKSHIYAVSQELMRGPGVDLFDHIAECLAKFVIKHGLNKHLPLGFTFSFPCKQLGLKKALLTRWTKGYMCSGVENEDVGRLLKEAIERRGDVDIAVVALLNDTTGTLMSCAHRNSDCRVGVIVGTGCNACYVENVKHVELLEKELKVENQQVIVNCEWGAFGDAGHLEIVRTEYDRKLDETSLNKSLQLFEKMTSGMYLGPIINLVLCAALERNLIFKHKPAKQVEILKLLRAQRNLFETKHISEVESDHLPAFNHTRRVIKELFGLETTSLEDCEKLRYICKCVSKRAATLVAIGISVLINRIEERKVVVGVDGSVYRYHPHFDFYMRETLELLLKPHKHYDIMLSEDGSGRGAALVAAVTARSSE